MPFVVPRVVTGVRDAEVARQRDLSAARTEALEAQNGLLVAQAAQLEEERAAAQQLARELSDANAQLAGQALELELAVQQLQDQATELEAQAVELQVTGLHLEERTEAADRARAEAEAANRAKSQFLTVMSHELRTPLNAVGGYAELLAMGLRGPVTDAQRADLERLQRANRHLIGLIADVLSFARIEGGQLELHTEAFELVSIVTDLEGLIGPQLLAKGLTFTHDGCTSGTPESPHRVLADVEKTRQILVNLLTNAIKFTDAGGRVALACESDTAARMLGIRVTDTGRGIPASHLARVFEPFVQVDRHLTQTSQQGVGLGLAISRDLARGMGGDLTVESAVGSGSTFTLTLPTPP
ncbi:hypothetical protein BH11GEM1_BH11GEM1_36230 [soil metagenome]